jgi:diketogulonate reductase-like aldo/keto reductase
MTSAVDQPTVALPGEVRMPLVGFGTWQATGRSAYDAVRAALDTGYRHLDTATMYGNEAEVGRAVRDSGVPREDVFITTKLPPSQAGRERETIGASLAALDTEYVDLWLIHWPPADAASIATWREFLAVRDEGLARAVGVSNFSTDQIDALIQATEEAPAVNQIRWSPSLFDAQRLAEHRERGVVLEGYSPFKTSDLQDPVLVRIAEAHGVTPAQVVLRWHVDHGIVVIPKSVTPERIKANFDVFGFSLTDDEVREIDALAR